MVKTWAYIFGFVFLAIGILGFVPAAIHDGKLLGIFAVNHMHNMIHLFTGVAGILAGFADSYWPALFLRIFGIVYLLVAAMGFYSGDAMLMGMIANNFADTILHLVTGAAALYLGFCWKCHRA